MKTQTTLDIVWNNAEGQELCAGIYLCGWFPEGPDEKCSEQIQNMFQSMGGVCHVRDIEQHGSVRIISVRLPRFPEEAIWREAMEAAFTILLDAGAAVTWAGGEDCSWHLEVLDPASDAGNVYAAKEHDLGFLCNTTLTDEIQYLTKGQLQALWRVVLQKRR